MKLALVFTGCFRRGGVERVVFEAARHLGRRHDVTVLADVWEDVGVAGVRYERVRPRMRPRSLVATSFAERATRAVADGRFDRVLSFGANCPAGDVLWVNSVHRAWLERRREESPSAALRYARPADRALLALERDRYGRRRYRRVLAVAAAVADDLERWYGVPQEDVEIVPNGFAPEEFSPARRESLRAEVRVELALADDDVALLMVANELRRKGLPVLLEALARVDDPRLRVLLVGRADPAAHAHRLLDRVRWLGPSDDVGRLHAAADAFVLPTQYEAACLAIVEALGSGLPVLTTRVPGAGDHVHNGATGLLQRDPFDAGELAAMLRRALDPARRAAWSAAAPASVAHLRWDAIFDRVDGLLAHDELRSAA